MLLPASLTAALVLALAGSCTPPAVDRATTDRVASDPPASLEAAPAPPARVGDAPPLPAAMPAWLDENRVQAHTRLGVSRWYGTPAFDAAQALTALGAQVFVRHVTSGGEPPPWPTAFGPPPAAPRRLGRTPPAGTNVAREIIDDAHRAGAHALLYYWHMTDDAVAARHPDWVCQTVGGETAASARGAFLDLTTPYREIVLGRLLELAAMGADGFYFDHRHLPDAGCRGTALEARYERETGRRVPARADDADPAFLQFVEFQAAQIEETFAYWRAGVRARYPEVAFVISTTHVPTLVNPRMTTGLAALADAPKSEFDIATRIGLNGRFFGPRNPMPEPPDDVRMALGWALLRDAADGRPPHVWASGFPDTPHTLGFVAALVTYGAIANLDVNETLLRGGAATRDGRHTPVEALRAGFALGRQASPSLHGTRPVRWAGVHFSEAARDRRRGDLARVWREVAWPVTGAFQVLVRDGLPAGVVTDAHLQADRLDGYQVLFLPTPDELTAGQQRTVEAFEARGGVVVRGSAWGWGDPRRHTEAMARMQTAFRQADRGATAAPVQVTGGPERRHAVAFETPGRERLVVAVTNDFSWVRPLLPEGRRERRAAGAPTPPARGVEVRLRLDRAPRRVVNALTGQALPVAWDGGEARVAIPPFAHLALLSVER